MVGALAVSYGAEESVSAQVSVAFNGRCEELLLAQIGAARSEILMAAYSITRRNIVQALIAAAERGVKIRVKYDAEQAEYEGMREAIVALRKRKIKCAEIRMSEEHASMHDKFVVIDREQVLTGSYNFTTPASEMNYENLVRIAVPAIAVEFAKAFDAIKSR